MFCSLINGLSKFNIEEEGDGGGGVSNKLSNEGVNV